MVKPLDSAHGKGVSVGLTKIRQVSEAVDNALKFSENVIVQEMIEGDEYRFLVIDEEVVAVAHRKPAYVVGNGKDNVEKLIEKKNKKEKRTEDHSGALQVINTMAVSSEFGAEILKKIPAEDEEIKLRRISNISQGGESVDCTNVADSALKNIAVRAAIAIGLKVAGVDIIVDDISNPSHYSVIELNASPGFGLHQEVTQGEKINIAKKFVDYMETHNE